MQTVSKSTKQILFEIPISCSRRLWAHFGAFSVAVLSKCNRNTLSLCLWCCRYLARWYPWTMTSENWPGIHRYMGLHQFAIELARVHIGHREREKNYIIIQQYAFQLVIFTTIIFHVCQSYIHYVSTSSKWLIFKNLLHHISLLLYNADQLAYGQIKQTWRISLFFPFITFALALVMPAFHPVKH